MLNVFNGKTPSPKYRLVPNPDGKLQTMTVAKEVKHNTLYGTIPPEADELYLDHANTSIRFWSYPERYQVHSG